MNWDDPNAFRDDFTSRNRKELIRLVAEQNWFHDFDFGDARTGSFVYPDDLPANYHLYPLLDLIKAEPVEGKRAIDIGSFDGLTAMILARQGAARVDATCQYDLDRFRIARALSGAEEVAYYPRCDLRRIEAYAPRGGYDLVIASAMMHHLTSPLELFTLSRRLLRDGGVCLFESLVVGDAPTGMTLNTLRQDPVFGVPTLWLPSLDTFLGMLEVACLQPLEVIKLAGGRDARESNYERYTVRAEAALPGIAPVGSKLAEFHETLSGYDGIDFVGMRQRRAEGPQPLRKQVKRSRSIWSAPPDLPLQPQDAPKQPRCRPALKCATYRDFARLKAMHPEAQLVWEDVSLLSIAYPGEGMPEGMSWGLKQCGYLFVLDSIERLGLSNILEIGPGFNLYLEHKLDPFVKLESLDDTGFYTPELFSAIQSQSRRGPYHLGLLGKAHPLVAETYDACVSISALEHVPPKDVEAVACDIFGLTQPGGWSIHSIDCRVSDVTQVANAWTDAFRKAGFDTHCIQTEALLQDSLHDGGPIFETTPILFRFHYGYQRDPWARSMNNEAIEGACTLLLRIRRPRR